MSNIGVNSLDNLFANQVQAKTSVKTTENFDETLKDVSENTKKPQMEAKSTEKTDVKKSDDEKETTVDKFGASKKREIVKKQGEPTEEQMVAAMEEVVSQIKEFIQERFGVTEEELNNLMTDLGITDNQILDVNVLSQIVMKLDGIEKPLDMLMSPNFNDDLKELLNKVEQIKSESFDLEKLVANVPEIQDTTFEEDVEQSGNVVEMDVVADDMSVQDDEVSVEKEVVEENVPENVEITTEQELNSNNDTKGQMDKKENHLEKTDTSEQVNINAVRPEDFAMRLTEDLSAKVGERQAITIVRQVVEQVSMQTKQGMTTMELQLYPAHLGRVVVQLVSKDGNVTAQITAETEAAKNALEGQLTLLKENLNNQGVKIENVEVTIASHAFEQNMQGERQSEEQSGSKNRGRRAIRGLNENIAVEVENTPEIMEVMGNTVSYSA